MAQAPSQALRRRVMATSTPTAMPYDPRVAGPERQRRPGLPMSLRRMTSPMNGGLAVGQCAEGDRLGRSVT